MTTTNTEFQQKAGYYARLARTGTTVRVQDQKRGVTLLLHREEKLKAVPKQTRAQAILAQIKSRKLKFNTDGLNSIEYQREVRS